MKPVPLIVRVCEAVPAVTNVGDKLVMVGTGLIAVTVKLTEDVPPPGVGLMTATGKTPAVAKSAVVSGMVSCAVPIKVAARPLPLKVTLELEMKLPPLIVRV
jgi:hypothetical protein